MKKLLITLILSPALAFSQWTLIHTFPSTPEHIQIVDSTIYVVTTLNGLFSSSDNGLSWIQKNNNISDTIIRAFYADTSILIAATGTGVNISFDGANTWTLNNTGINNPNGVFSVSKSGNNLLCGTLGTFAGDSATLHLSTNTGSSWTQQLSITSNSGFPAFAVKSGFVVASSYSGDFYYSTNYGVAYTSVSTPFAAEDMVITNSSIVVAASDGGINKIKYSLNNGLSWQIGKDTITAQDFKNISDTVYTATLFGFYYSFDAGSNWFENNNGLPASKQCYAVAAKGNDLWLGHHSGNLYKLPLSQIIGIERLVNRNGIAVFPNPFSSSTTMQTDQIAADATLTVYNSYGQQVKQIKNIYGKTITLHRGNLPSGLYFIRLTQDKKTFSVDKLVVLDN